MDPTHYSLCQRPNSPYHVSSRLFVRSTLVSGYVSDMMFDPASLGISLICHSLLIRKGKSRHPSQIRIWYPEVSTTNVSS